MQTPPADEPVQTTAPVEPAPEDAAEDEVEAVVVTGTRLRIRDYVAPSPVTTITAETLTFSGATNVTDFLQDIECGLLCHVRL